jgi:glutamate synthase domain-containing protein 2/glutamate synthase domain-containing protein 1/glutamate synthase domain-containing protein 3
VTSFDRRLAPRGGPRPDRALERDACGIGFVADVTGRTDRRVVELGLQGLASLRHRGAFAADEQTGDGAGVLFPIPRRLICHVVGATSAEASDLGLLMLFIADRRSAGEVCAAVEDACGRERLRIVRWRDVPVDPSALGDHARDTRPRILQAVLRAPSADDAARSEQRAHRARRRIDAFARAADRDVYVASCSFATVTYKALAAADRLAAFYPDLLDPDVEAPFIVFHQRYSTNTAPTWERAQPFRMLCHNGEINTIAGNANRMHAREGRLGLTTLAEEALFRPAIDDAGSDSAILDETVELLTKEGGVGGSGRDIRRAVAMVVPAAWEDAPDMDRERRGFYRWHSSLMEPWDGPAALIFTDGVAVGAALDRNGLRPLRYWATDDGLVVCASEAGVVDLPEGGLRRGKLGPGQMIVVDPRKGGLDDDAIGAVANEAPWAGWAEEHRIARLPEMPRAESLLADELMTKQILHGYTREDLSMMIRPAAAHGKEPTFSMGDDTPIAALSRHGRSIFNHLRQRFAQVTNPAMDHLRERSVMSLAVLLGPRAPLLSDDPHAAALEEFDSFFRWERPAGRRLDATWRAGRGAPGLRVALRRLGSEAVAAAADGEPILVVSDADAGPDRAPIPSVLAVGAVNVALTNAGMRTRCSIVAEVDDARESHHVACLLAVGAEAIRLPLAAATVAALSRGGENDDAVSSALARYREAIEDGIRKTLAKLGISCVDSYRGAEVVDVLGLDDEIARTCFVSTPTVLGGLGLDDLAAAVLERHAVAYGTVDRVLANPGYVKFRNGGEHHATEPAVVRAVHRIADPALERLRTNASGAKGQAADDEMDAAHALNRAIKAPERPDLYARYAAIVHARPPTAIRDLLAFVPSESPVPLDEVEPVERILARFSTGAISHGSISAEAHETLALAMNAIGGRSNTGEGGEDPARYRTAKNSKIKQIASARFGVTPEYCAFAEELQIKIAQGSKPGEGGQLPGHKVTDEIARLRHTQPGVALISPAPHHDIYSIEDLAQLVFDLKQVNPSAAISVKLVAEEGVGAVALGVAKALADVVHIAGADGGTGASPLSSIKNAGLPWELGLVEAQREMAESGLRSRVRLRVDGGLKTGRDVMVAALLGADEYSFGTAALLAEGCLMVRTCHLDTCPVGIATQRPELRAKFAGTPEMVEAFMRAVAQEVRELLSCLGSRSLDDVIGRVDLLRVREVDAPHLLDLEPLLRRPLGERRSIATDAIVRPSSVLGDRLFDAAWPAVRDGAHVELELPIANGDRAVGARLGGAIGRAFGMTHPPGSVRARFHGAAGQSFGAFLADGIELRLTGEANDYVGKGMGGGRIAIAAPPDDAGDPWLAGNTVLYGATGGELFIAGRAGERFAVRNSGALAVVEGVGDHACEYMTGGTVVVLGPVGRNLAAGMTGGELFVHDPDGRVPIRLNPELVEARPATPEALERLHLLVRRHHELTGSGRAAMLLTDWDRHAGEMQHVRPRPDLATIVGVQEGTRITATPVRATPARPLRAVRTS